MWRAIALSVLIGCGGAPSAEPPSSAMSKPEPVSRTSAARGPAVEAAPGASDASAGAGKQDAALAPDVARQVIRRAEMSLVVDGLEAAAAGLTAAVQGAGGYVERSELGPDGPHAHGALTLRVPDAALESVMAGASAVAVRVDRRVLSTEDVTTQVIDLDAQIHNQEVLEARLQTLLGTARDVEAALRVETELAQVRTRIDAARGRVTGLRRQVALATLTVQLTQGEGAGGVVLGSWSATEELRGALEALVGGMQGLASLAIWLGVVIVPVLTVALAPFWLLWRWVRRRRA
jgi:hypothetical protein